MYDRKAIMNRAWEIYEARHGSRKLVSVNDFGRRFDQRQRGWGFSLAMQAAWNEAKVAARTVLEGRADRIASLKTEIAMADFLPIKINRRAYVAIREAEIARLAA